MTTLEYLRHFHFFGYAIFDLTASFLGMALISPLLSRLFLKIKVYIPKLNWVFLTLPIGILAHIIVGRITPMTANFLDLHGYFILKVIIIGCLALGVMGIKIIK